MANMILSVGFDRQLMTVRTMVLRHEEFEVKEAYSVNEAIECLHQIKRVDFILLCHSIPGHEQKQIIAASHDWNPLLPVLCVEPDAYAYPSMHEGCYSVENVAPMFLRDIRKILQKTRSRRSA